MRASPLDERRTFRTSEGSDEEGNKAYRQGASSYIKYIISCIKYLKTKRLNGR